MKSTDTQNRNWDGTTYGNQWMHNSLMSLLRVLDVRIVYCFASVFVVPFTLMRQGASIMYRFFRERLGYCKVKALWAVYQNHCKFAQVVIDRFAMYAGKRFVVHIHEYENFDRLAKQDDGFLQFSAHIGNYEIAGYSLNSDKKPMNALVFAGEKDSVMNYRNKMFGSHGISMIPIQRDMSHLYAVNNALSQGEIVSFPADRTFGSEKTVQVDFLGAQVRLPAGPFRVAVMRECKVLAVNAMKTGLRKYDIFVNELSWNKELNSNQQVEELACAYACQLEQAVRRYPTQWYNYFDFWKQ